MVNRIFLRVILGFFFMIIAVPFLLPKKQVDLKKFEGSSTGVSAHAVKANTFAPGQLQAHFIKHGYQFGPITENEYLEDARKLLDAPEGSGVLEKIRENGDILRYNPATNEFGVMTPTGRIRTYFKTNDQYWNRQ